MPHRVDRLPCSHAALGNPIVVYSSTEGPTASFDIVVASGTDLDEITSVLTSAISAVDHVLDEPGPPVQASGITNNEIELSISYWCPATLSGSQR